MKNNVMNLPLSVIEEAITGNRESIDTIIEQYSMLINDYSTRKVAGTNEYRLDSYMKSSIEVELIATILKFEIRRQYKKSMVPAELVNLAGILSKNMR